ncbi:MAG: hypothetical protein WAM95_19555 [Bacillus sp. (in: firmicutes)]
MKRYWKFIILSLITVIVIGTFYISASSAEKTDLFIEFEKVNGNEEELKDLTFYGDYLVGNMYQPLQFTTEKTTIPNDITFLERLSPEYNGPIFKELIKNHKRFMRGKEIAPNYYFEDENVLVYANFKGDFESSPNRDVIFDIEVLDKKTKEKISFKSDVPFSEKYEWLNIEDVQVVQDEIKLVVQGRGMKDGTDDLRVYTFDMKEQLLVGNEPITTADSKENTLDIRVLNELYSTIQSQKFYVIHKATYEAQNDRNEGDAVTYEGEPKVVANELLVYNIENNEVKQLEIPTEITESLYRASILQSSMYTFTQTGHVIEVSQYDFEKEEWAKKQIFHSEQAKTSENEPYVKLMNGKIYIISSTNNGYTLLIGDLNTGESLYEGKLHVKNQKEDPQRYRLYFNEIDSE